MSAFDVSTEPQAAAAAPRRRSRKAARRHLVQSLPGAQGARMCVGALVGLVALAGVAGWLVQALAG
jgi:hypothetical protein